MIQQLLVVGLCLISTASRRHLYAQDSLEKLLQQVEQTKTAHQKAVAALEGELANLKARTLLIERILAESKGTVAAPLAAVADPRPKPEVKPTKTLTLEPDTFSLDLGDSQKITPKLDNKQISAEELKKLTLEVNANPSEIAGVKFSENIAVDKGQISVQAPENLGEGVNSVTSKLTINLKDADTLVGRQTVNLTIARSVDGANWESRAIMGFHQAGASSAPSTQKAFFDFYIARALGNHRNLYDARLSLWGNIRIASSPQQTDVPVSQFAAGFVGRLADIKVNNLAQSAEFLTGLEWRVARAKWTQGDRIRTLGMIAFFGANGSFSDPFGSGKIFAIPKQVAGSTVANPHVDQFRNARFGSAAGSTIMDTGVDYVGIIPPDRERFFRQYGAGLRLTSYDKTKPIAPPATYAVTLGQDQLITSGYYRGPVMRLDVFYPLPFDTKEGKWKFLFLFGTVNMRLARSFNLHPLSLQDRAVCGNGISTACSNFYDPSVRTVAVPSARDTYRMGIGLDFVNLVRSFITIGDAAKQTAGIAAKEAAAVAK